MANEMTIGRFAFRVNDRSYQGNRLVITGYLLPTTDTANAVLASRQQLRGYVDGIDEDVVPVTWLVDTSVNGWYRVISATVDDKAQALGSVGTVQVELERYGTSFTGVQQETVGTSITRTNPAGATAAAMWAIPAVATAFNPPVGWKAAALASRTADTGALTLVSIDPSAAAVTGQYAIAPGSAFVGASVVEHNFGGGTYYPMVGRHCALSATSWRLNNGLMRITPSVTANHLIDISVFDGTSTWSTPTAWTLSQFNNIAATANASAFNPSIVSARILRNSREVSIVRIGFIFGSATFGATASNRVAGAVEAVHRTQFVDIALRRGDRVVSLAVSNRPIYAGSYEILQMNGTPAATAITGGAVQTAADASGNKAVVMTANTISTAPTTLSLSTGPTLTTTGVQYAIGYVVPAAAAAPHAAADLVQQYIGAVAEKERSVLA